MMYSCDHNKVKALHVPLTVAFAAAVITLLVTCVHVALTQVSVFNTAIFFAGALGLYLWYVAMDTAWREVSHYGMVAHYASRVITAIGAVTVLLHMALFVGAAVVALGWPSWIGIIPGLAIGILLPYMGSQTVWWMANSPQLD